MRFTKHGALALVALSLISFDAHAARIDRKFHPVVNDDPQNAHLNVQTPGADINQTVVIKEEPGPDGQVIPAGDTKVASCVGKDANGDIDLSGGGSCSSSTGPIAERATVTASTIGRAALPSARTASRTIPSLASASPARAGNASSAPPATIEAAPIAAPLPAQRIEGARVAALPGKQMARAVRSDGAVTGIAPTRWLEIGLFALAAVMLVAVGLALLFRMGLAHLLVLRGGGARRTGEEEQIAASAVDPLLSP